jgi:hypothetical protein
MQAKVTERQQRLIHPPPPMPMIKTRVAQHDQESSFHTRTDTKKRPVIPRSPEELWRRGASLDPP